jgi:hypothetical protein
MRGDEETLFLKQENWTFGSPLRWQRRRVICDLVVTTMLLLIPERNAV